MPTMRKPRNRPNVKGDTRPRARAAEDEDELALLAQFMRHDSVASLADAIAKGARVRGKDLIAAACLDAGLADE